MTTLFIILYLATGVLGALLYLYDAIESSPLTVGGVILIAASVLLGPVNLIYALVVGYIEGSGVFGRPL